MKYRTYAFLLIFTILGADQLFGLPLIEFDESAKICISKLAQSISISDNEKITKDFLQLAIKQCEQLAGIISEKKFNESSKTNEVNSIREKRSPKKSNANSKKEGNTDRKSTKEGKPVKKSKNKDKTDKKLKRNQTGDKKTNKGIKEKSCLLVSKNKKKKSKSNDISKNKKKSKGGKQDSKNKGKSKSIGNGKRRRKRGHRHTSDKGEDNRWS